MPFVLAIRFENPVSSSQGAGSGALRSDEDAHAAPATLPALVRKGLIASRRCGSLPSTPAAMPAAPLVRSAVAGDAQW